MLSVGVTDGTTAATLTTRLELGCGISTESVPHIEQLGLTEYLYLTKMTRNHKHAKIGDEGGVRASMCILSCEYARSDAIFNSATLVMSLYHNKMKEFVGVQPKISAHT